MERRPGGGPTENGLGREIEREALGGGRQAARQHGRRRVQARRAGPDLPEVHLGRVRGAPRAAAGRAGPGGRSRRTRTSTAPRTSSGCRRRRAGRTSGQARSSPTIGKTVDDAMDAIERRQPPAQGVLPKDYARPALDKTRLGELIDLIGTIGLGRQGEHRARHPRAGLRVFPAQFASAEGKKGGQFYTPQRVVALLVEMLAPYKGRVFDPCCGSGGMFVQQREVRREHHGGRLGDISHLRAGIEPDHLAPRQHEPRHPRHRRQHRARRQLPQRPAPGPQGRLRPGQPALQRQRLGRRAAARGRALEIRRAAGRQRQLRLGAALPPPSRAAPASPASCWPTARCRSQQSGEGEIRKALVEADLVDCMVALPGQLFYSTQIPVCLWFLARDKKNGPVARPARRDPVHRRAQARPDGGPRRIATLDDEDIARIAGTYHAWRGDPDAGAYVDEPGYCKARH